MAMAALALIGFGSGAGLSGGLVRSNLAAMVQSASELIAQRSPGIRTRAVMGKGKAGKDVRFARALPRVRQAPVEGAALPIASAAAATPPVLPFAAPAEPALPVAIASAGPGTGGVLAPGGDGFFLFAPVPGPGIVGGGPGGGVIIGETTPTPEPTPSPPIREIPPAIPEPASWAMMLIGFGVLGMGVRRRRRPATA